LIASKKINKNKWLHSVLDQVATRCFGVDILEDEVDFVRHSLGFDDVGVADITAAILKQAKGTDWDYVMIPEVLEHVDNPVAFLSGIKKVWTGHAKKIVITVPNAFTPSNYRFARRKVEKINTDHRFWLTPYTLAKVVMQAGLRVDLIVMCHHGRVKKRAFFRNLWFKRNPLLRSDIVMLVDFE
jgi:2-polyprenyl-3-methyl-5-hydroxy-6-metoxy-1,4-benzoquinol methylase